MVQINIAKPLKFWNDNEANFPDGMYIASRMQFPHWILQVSTTCGDSRSGSESEDHARHLHIQKRQDIPGNQVQSLEHKALSFPLPHLEYENILGIGKETWSQVQAPTLNPSTTNPVTTHLSATKPAMTSPTKHQP